MMAVNIIIMSAEVIIMIATVIIMLMAAVITKMMLAIIITKKVAVTKGGGAEVQVNPNAAGPTFVTYINEQ